MQLNDLRRFFKEHWLEPSGLLALLIICGGFVTTITISNHLAWWVTLLCLLATSSLLVAAWVWSRRAPRTARNKIGFLVSIACLDDTESVKLREDFVIPLRQAIKSGRVGHTFHFIEVPQHLARTIIEEEDAIALRRKCKAHFCIFGSVRLRDLDGKPHHIIKMDGLVLHGPVSGQVSEQISQEFAELLPRNVHISTENDLFSFQFTTEWADLVARYIIGIASGCSGDLDYAESLFQDVKDRLRGKDPNFPVFGKLSKRIVVRLSEISEARARTAYQRWTKDHTAGHLEDIGRHLGDVPESRRTNPSFIHLNAIYSFLARRNAREMLAYLKQHPQANAVWHLNTAFLNGYCGNLKTASRHYTKASMFEIAPETLSEVEEFMCWLIEDEPSKKHLYYCLGLFNWKIKGDTVQAQEDFRRFIQLSKPQDFTKEKELAALWINEL